MKRIAMALLLALLAGACNSSPPDNSSTQPTGLTQAQADQRDQSPFCRAVEGISPYPFDDFAFGDYDAATETAQDADADELAAASASYRAVAEVVPSTAPSIVHRYFAVIPDTVDSRLQPEAADRGFLADLVIAGSIDAADIEQFVTSACPSAGFERQPFTPADFGVLPLTLVSASETGFCDALEEFATASVALQTSTTAVRDDFAEGSARALVVASLLGPDADRTTAALMSLFPAFLASLVTDQSLANEIQPILATFDTSVVRSDLRSMCPGGTDPAAWLPAN